VAEPTPAHGLIVLAAGASRRLGRSKQLLRLDGETLVRRAARLGLQTAPHTAVIVLAPGADAVFAQVCDLALRRVDCADADRGMGASLRAGLAALPDACGAALVLLCDQPALDSAHLLELCAAWRASPQQAAATQYAGTLGVPAVLPRAWFTELGDAESDRGARALIAARASDVIALPNEALGNDIDDASDLGVIDS
jgi:molybdenum cofactor cytidylyltransferase